MNSCSYSFVKWRKKIQSLIENNCHRKKATKINKTSSYKYCTLSQTFEGDIHFSRVYEIISKKISRLFYSTFN